ncbi:MAG: thioredoxin family protein [Candidatus Electryonea clarkiae]|nr:thioredoxin family protein [Candidatus Electryonea clarkiae]MDP8285361.1 thioredoxin family protein [Candidatus Electryonea clarkiae]
MPFSLPSSILSQGLTWEEYLENTYAPALQKRRFDQNIEAAVLRHFKNLKLNRKIIILVHPPCGDCAWSVPYIMRLISESSVLDAKIFARDEYPELMDELLTNGKRSIPKVAVLDDDNNLVGTWGPRPAVIQKYVEKSVGHVDRSEWMPKVMKYYKEDGLKDLHREISELFFED